MNESGHNRKILKKKSNKRIIVINTVKEAANTRIKSKDVGISSRKDSTVVRIGQECFEQPINSLQNMEERG